MAYACQGTKNENWIAARNEIYFTTKFPILKLHFTQYFQTTNLIKRNELKRAVSHNTQTYAHARSHTRRNEEKAEKARWNELRYDMITTNKQGICPNSNYRIRTKLIMHTHKFMFVYI